MRKAKLVFVGALATALAAGVLYAQAPGFKRIPVQDQDLSVPGRHAVQAKAEFEPGGVVGKHTHPGEELGIVLEGQLLLEVAGQPARTVKAGESIFIPPNTVHSAKNTARGKTVVFSTYIVEKGKPVAIAVK